MPSGREYKDYTGLSDEDILSEDEKRLIKELEVVRAARIKVLTNGISSYNIGGRTLSYQNPNDITNVEKSLMAQLRVARRERLITDGRCDPNKIKVEFSEWR